MDKAAFLKQLSGALATCGKNDRKKSLSYYSELIEDYMEDGMDEAEAVALLGSPAAIAADILEEQSSSRRFPLGVYVLIGILLVLGFPLWGSLVLTAVLLILSGYVLLWCVPLICASFTLAALILAAVSVPGSLAVMSYSPALAIMQLGMGMMSAGAFIVGAWLSVVLCKFFARMTKKITLYFVGWFRREGVEK